MPAWVTEHAGKVWHRIRRSATQRPPVLRGLGWVSVVIALVLMGAGVPLNVTQSGVPLVLALLAAILQCGSLVVVLDRPRLAALAQVAGLLIIALSAATPGEAPWPIPVSGIVALAIFMGLLGLREPWGLTVAAFAAGAAALFVSVAVRPDANSGWSINLSVAGTAAACTVMVAVGIAQWRIIRRELADAREATEVEAGRARWAQERGRIAREMHDVVAHSMSIVHMRASSAPFRFASLPGDASGEFVAIAEQARTALVEMRQLLGVLREDDERLTDPQPTLADLDELVDGARAAGVRVTARLDLPDPCPHLASQLAIYRAAQEGLSNVVRHAPGSNVQVSLGVDATSPRSPVLVLEVVDDGSSTLVSEPSRPGPGLGIAGMVERVSLVGGSVVTGARDDGWAVTVQVPLPEGASS